MVTIWVRAELNAGLVAAAIPPLKSLFENVLRNVFGVRSQMRSATDYATKNAGTRPSRNRDLEDDEIAMRSHTAYVHGSNDFRPHQSDGESADCGSSVFEDQHGVVGSGERKNDSGEYGHGPITKTMSYTVRHDQQHKSA